MAVPGWLPDWRDESQYPSKDAKVTDLIWEFLRRSPSFQKDFANCPEKQSGSRKECRELAGKYGLRFPFVFCPPTSANDALVLLDTHNSPRILGYELSYKDPEETDATVVIDLLHPIDRQLERLGPILKSLQESLKKGGHEIIERRNHLKKMPAYLRVLDAYSYGVDKSEIAAKIFPGSKNNYPDYSGRRRVEATYAAAAKIRDGGYRWLGFAG